MNKAKMNNDLSMEGIMAEFKSYKTGKQKAKFLREMANLNLPYDVKWENLAQCYEGSKSWPVYKSDKKEKDENILEPHMAPITVQAAVSSMLVDNNSLQVA